MLEATIGLLFLCYFFIKIFESVYVCIIFHHLKYKFFLTTIISYKQV